MLVVEDERVARDALQALFALNGYEVAVAATVAEGLKLLDPPPECMILDLDLPDGPGEGILRMIREANLPTRVMITTGCGDLARLNAVASFKPEALLQKPVHVEELLAACGTDFACSDDHEAPDARG
jgi:DNA-binding response OmpR family regulator